ncbi:hypothetical protein IFM89_002113 [Coptis chinensis]|uniref:Uncharacterized protein n=1 Tax=Coptis chinensis TaxID=261450 RepID=A0A835LD65_9MAGN|nr:hypothetical protein IFM89_002113 [Coptis chinensis]
MTPRIFEFLMRKICCSLKAHSPSTWSMLALSGISPMISALSMDDSKSTSPIYLLPRFPNEIVEDRDWRVPIEAPKQMWLLHVGDKEDDGYLLVVEYAVSVQRCYLVILDPRRIGSRSLAEGLKFPKLKFSSCFSWFWVERISCFNSRCMEANHFSDASSRRENLNICGHQFTTIES